MANIIRRTAPVIVRKKKQPQPPEQKYSGPTMRMCRPKLIYSLDHKSILTTSKWFPNNHVAIYDWLQRGFVVIEDAKCGGGFEWRDFPICNIEATAEKYREKFKMEDSNGVNKKTER